MWLDCFCLCKDSIKSKWIWETCLLHGAVLPLESHDRWEEDRSAFLWVLREERKTRYIEFWMALESWLSAKSKPYDVVFKGGFCNSDLIFEEVAWWAMVSTQGYCNVFITSLMAYHRVLFPSIGAHNLSAQEGSLLPLDGYAELRKVYNCRALQRCMSPYC